MSTSPNPEHLLRRPRKAQTGQTSNNLKFGFAVTAAVVVIAAIAGTFMFGHGHNAANATGPSAAAQVALAPPAPNLGSTFAVVHPKHPGGKSGPASKPVAGASPSPVPTTTPGVTPTPTASHPKSPAEIAKAKHQAALRLAALKRQQTGSQTDTTSLLSATPDPGIANASAVQATAPPIQPVATLPPTSEPVSATPNPEPTPVYAPTVVVEARFIDRIAPAYPDIAREQGAQGTAIVLATVGPKGSVISVALDQSTGNKVLDQSALSAARASKFQPPEIDGKPATETYRIVYTFSL